MQPVDSNDIQLEKKATNMATTDSSCKSLCVMKKLGGSCKSSTLFQAFMALFVVLNITALYILHFANRPSTTTQLAVEKFSSVEGFDPKVGDTVSFNTQGVLRKGAGTTVYLDATKIEDGEMFEYISFAPMGTSKTSYDTNLMAFTRTVNGKTESVLTTAAVDTNKKATIAEPKSSNILSSEKIRAIATLSDSTAVALVVNKDYEVSVIPINIAGNGVTLNQAKKEGVVSGQYVMAAYISRLSAATFAVVYFDPYSGPTYKQNVKVGSVKADGTISFSSADVVGPNSDANGWMVDFGAPLGIASSPDTFIVPYYTSSFNTSAPGSASGLCVSVFKYDSKKDDVSTKNTACSTKVQPHYLPSSTMISNNALAIAFHDNANNNALTVAVVSISAHDDGAFIRNIHVLNDVSGEFEFGDPYGFSPTPSIKALAGSRVALSFFNPANEGKPSTVVLKYSETFMFTPVTPTLPVAIPEFSLYLTSGKDQSAVTTDLIPVGEDSFLTAYLGHRDQKNSKRISLVEVYGQPVGVIKSQSGKDASISMAGQSPVTGEKLSVGASYYAMTNGQTVTATKHKDASHKSYVYVKDDSVLVTTDSKVGIALDEVSLFISP